MFFSYRATTRQPITSAEHNATAVHVSPHNRRTSHNLRRKDGSFNPAVGHYDAQTENAQPSFVGSNPPPETTLRDDSNSAYRESKSLWDFFISSRFSCCFQQPYYHIRITGPSMAGKTSFVRRLRYGHFVETHPTKVTEVSYIKWHGKSFVFWDSRTRKDEENKPTVPIIFNFPVSQTNKKHILTPYRTDALIYAVDLSNPGRLKIAAKHIKKVLRRYHDVPIVLILGIKKDLGNYVKQDEIESQLRIIEITYDRECRVFFVSNVSGEGVNDAMEWLYWKISESSSCTFPYFKFHLRPISFFQDSKSRCFSLGWNLFNCCDSPASPLH